MRRAAVPVAVLLVAVLTATTACGARPERSEPDAPKAPAADGAVTEAAGPASIGAPRPAGKGSFATERASGTGDAAANGVPTKQPVQAGPDLRGQALPTNQWWTSALTGPYTQPLWAHPLAVRATAAGIQVSSARPVASANAVVTAFDPALTAGGPVTGVTVTGYGAFHVVLRAALAGGGAIEATVVQGSPLLYLRFDGTPAVMSGAGARLDGRGARVTAAGQQWDLLAASGWRQDGDRLVADTDDGRIAVARVPDGVDEAAWKGAVADAATDPVTGTSAAMTYDRTTGTVTQTLTATRRSGGPGVWALLPHHRAGLVNEDITTIPGSYPDARGELSLVDGAAVRIRVPMPGLLTAAPSVPTSAPQALTADLDRDLATEPDPAGSYFDLKELGRLATIAQVAQRAGAQRQRQIALDRLRPLLVDWLTHNDDRDDRYFAYDRSWGGLIAAPAEFGSNDYNDHNFQYGYLVRAAAVLAEADPEFRRDYGEAVTLIATEYTGTLGTDVAAGFPPFRSFNAYLGHSAASGFVPFADGNNQESSGEAVAAWEAVVRWGQVMGRAELVDHGVTHYAMEAATARMYWLGQGLQRPPGYTHTVAGIVWDAKIDYATFFDPKPESVQGIQLLPLTFGSLYRAQPQSAAGRAAELSRAAGGQPRVWGDLFAADLAAADPRAALDRLRGDLPVEESTSRAMVRSYVEMLAALGPPQPAVTADGPNGMAFGSADKPVLAAVNPSGERLTVTFRRDGKEIARIDVDPGQAVTRRL